MITLYTMIVVIVERTGTLHVNELPRLCWLPLVESNDHSIVHIESRASLLDTAGRKTSSTSGIMDQDTLTKISWLEQ